MATKQIAWNTGSGNITLTYQGQGNGTITIQTDANNLRQDRTQQVTVKTSDGSNIQRVVTISQAAMAVIDISTATVTAPTQTYSGNAKTPTPTVTLNGETIPSTGYDVSYSNNINAGTATITVTGKGNYTGSSTGTFIINKASPSYTAPSSRSITYTGSLQYLTTAGSTSDGTIQYSEDGSSWSTTRIRKTTAGTYTTYWRLIGDSNHTDINSTAIDTTIAKANASISYSTTNVVKTHTGGVTFTNSLTDTGDGYITYSSSNTSVATINSNGLVTIVGVGSATITAYAYDGTNYAYSTDTAYYYITSKSYAEDAGYVTRGLVFALDGINKGNDSSNWVDLAGGLKFPWANCTTSTNKVTFNGSGIMQAYSSKRFYQSSYTIEVVFENKGTGQAARSFILFPAKSGDLLFGFSYGNIAGDTYTWGSTTAPLYRAAKSDRIVSYNADRHVVNGREQTTSISNDSWGAQINNYIKIGGRGTDRFFTGDIYSIRIYNRKLSYSEIIQNQTVDNTRFNLGIHLDESYISDGLVFNLDGINKGPNSGYWTDSVGGIKFPTTNCIVNTNNVQLKGIPSQSTSTATFSSSTHTIEVVCENNDTGWKVIFFPPKSSGIAQIRNYDTNSMYIDYSTTAEKYYSNYVSKLISINSSICVVGCGLATKDTTETWRITDGKMTIGGRGTNEYLYSGKIYAIRIYNRILSQSEIVQNQRLDNKRFSLGEKV